MSDLKLIQFLKEKNNDLYQSIRMCEVLDEENNDIIYITGDSKEELAVSLFKNLKRLFAIFFPELVFEGGDEGGEFYLDNHPIRLETWVGRPGIEKQDFYSKFNLLETYFNKYFVRLETDLTEKFGYKVSSIMENNNDIQLYFRFTVETL